MKPILHDKHRSRVEVTNISKHGLWLLTRDHELFISFKEFPQFQDASVSKIMKVEQPNPNFLHWPDLGIDLAVESVRCFPLVPTKSIPMGRSDQHAKVGPLTHSKSDLRSSLIRTSPKEQDTTSPRLPHFPNTIGHAKGDEGGTTQGTD